MSGTLHHCILVPQGEVRRRGSHFSLQEKLEAWLETCGLCGCEWGGCEWGGIHDMCESHNQLKIHYYALTSSHPHILTPSLTLPYPPFPAMHLQDPITQIGRVFPTYCFLLCTLPNGFLPFFTHSSHHGRLKPSLLLCTLELCERSEGRRMRE